MLEPEEIMLHLKQRDFDLYVFEVVSIFKEDRIRLLWVQMCAAQKPVEAQCRGVRQSNVYS